MYEFDNEEFRNDWEIEAQLKQWRVLGKPGKFMVEREINGDWKSPHPEYFSTLSAALKYLAEKISQ